MFKKLDPIYRNDILAKIVQSDEHSLLTNKNRRSGTPDVELQEPNYTITHRNDVLASVVWSDGHFVLTFILETNT